MTNVLPVAECDVEVAQRNCWIFYGMENVDFKEDFSLKPTSPLMRKLLFTLLIFKIKPQMIENVDYKKVEFIYRPQPDSIKTLIHTAGNWVCPHV